MLFRPSCAMSLRLASGALLVATGMAAASPAKDTAAVSCPLMGTETARVAKIDERLDLTLTDGRSLKLAGLDPPQPTKAAPDLPEKTRDALAARLGQTISFFPLASQPDRWGRIPAFVFTASGSLADFLLAQGLARFMPDAEAHACRAEFLAAEETARSQKLGLWRDPFYGIIAASDRAAFADKGATNVIMEGRLAEVATTRFRSTLEFAPRRDHAASVTILQRNVAIFERSGLNLHALIGRMLRIRGLLDLRFGPQIEIATIDAVELIANEQTLNEQPKGGAGRQSGASAPPPSTRDP